jgi:hypothetical protein
MSLLYLEIRTEIIIYFRAPNRSCESFSYSAGITKATTRQPTFCVDIDVLLEILEQNGLKHVISPILAIFDLLEQIVLRKINFCGRVCVLHLKSPNCLHSLSEHG